MSSSRSHGEGRVQGLSGAPGWLRYAMRPWGNHTGYDELYQLTRQTTTGTSGVAADIGYEFAATANNGRIVSRTNYQRGVVDGEKVSYLYDALNRLVEAKGTTKNSGGTTVNTWGQDFGYDGFGNLLSQAPKIGYPDASPNVLLTVNAANNRISSTNWIYDGNGNTTRMPVVGGGYADMTYDVDNRMRTWRGPASQIEEEYGYLADNKRVWKKTPAGAETYYLYGVGGQRLMTCSIVASPFSLICSMTHVYFGGKLIRADGGPVVHDRLGSVVARGNAYGSGMVTKRDHFPYGDEIGGATSGNLNKFGTYTRDATTGLDYADQRYYAGTLGGRFLTADPYEASGGASESGSWNRYPYVGGDPVNFRDSRGLWWEPANFMADVFSRPAEGGGWFGGFDAWGMLPWELFPLPGVGGGGGGASSFFPRKITIEEKNAKIGQIELALLTAWRAGESDEQDGKPYPKYLKVMSDTYSCFGKVVQRNITYQLFGSDDNPINSGVITESLFQTDYDEPIIRRPAINSSSGAIPGKFEDEISNQFGAFRSYLQSFTVRGSSASLAGITNIPVYVFGFGGTYGVLSINRTSTYVEINGDRGTPKKCD